MPEQPKSVTVPVDEVIGKTRFVGTVTYVEDPERLARVRQMIVDFLVHNIVTGKLDHKLKRPAAG